MKILVTGAAGFIGYHLIKSILAHEWKVVGVDCLNDYYDRNLKLSRLSEIDRLVRCKGASDQYSFQELNISDKTTMERLFSSGGFDVVINLAAQAGVRYSIDNPHAYIESNVVGFTNILEGCAKNKVSHLIYASSSSVYGMNVKQPFSTADCVDFPISLYAATKKSNELMAHVYSHLYSLPTTGLRFFTVYGPYGRPDMAYYKFTKSILEGVPIDVYNHGQMRRDFTYIDDIIEGVLRVIGHAPKPLNNHMVSSVAPYKIYNIGNNNPVTLRSFIAAIESACGKKAIERLLPMQPGDVMTTYADIDDLHADLGFNPATPLDVGIEKFVTWYRGFYGY